MRDVDHQTVEDKFVQQFGGAANRQAGRLGKRRHGEQGRPARRRFSRRHPFLIVQTAACPVELTERDLKGMEKALDSKC